MVHATITVIMAVLVTTVAVLVTTVAALAITVVLVITIEVLVITIEALAITVAIMVLAVIGNQPLKTRTGECGFFVPASMKNETMLSCLDRRKIEQEDKPPSPMTIH